MNTDIPLIRSVLHPTDFSAASNRAFAHALAIALLRQTELTILHVSDYGRDDIPWDDFPEVRRTLERWKLLEPGSPRSSVYDKFAVDVRKIAVRGSHPVGPTLRFLERQPHDLVVLATESGGSNTSDWLRASSAEGISRGSGAMTLFVPAGARREMVSLDTGDLNVRNILVAIDPGIGFSLATEFARRTADVLGDGDVSITLLHVGSTMPPLPALQEDSRWVWKTDLRDGDVVNAIRTAADEYQADLIIMTTNGRDTLGQALQGSTTERVLRSAKCPVLAVPEQR